MCGPNTQTVRFHYIVSRNGVGCDGVCPSSQKQRIVQTSEIGGGNRREHSRKKVCFSQILLCTGTHFVWRVVMRCSMPLWTYSPPPDKLAQ